MIEWLLARVKESTTWAGTGVVAVALSQFFGLAPDQVNAVLNLGAAVAGAYMIFFKEKK